MTAKVVALPRSKDRLAPLAQRFLGSSDFTSGTRRVYAATLAALIDDLGEDRPIATVTTEEIEDHLDRRYATAAAATYNRSRATIASFFAWAADKHLIGPNPVTAVRRHKMRTTKIERDRSRVLSYDDLKAIWSSPGVALRDRTLWSLLYDTGARAEEILQLDIEDLDLPERRAQITGKGGHAETVHWATATARLLPRLIGTRDGGPLFVTERRARQATAADDLDRSTGRARLSYRRAAELFKEASGGRTLHEIRHARITHLVASGADIAMVMAKSRHTSLRSVQRYIHPTDDDVARLTRDHDPASRRQRRGR